MNRKYCADCGQPNLDTEAHCWACGSARFAPPGTKPVGDRTMAFGYSAGDQTVAWDGATPRRPAWVMPSAVAGLAVLACLGGYLVGRATWSRPAPAPTSARVTNVTLPALPSTLPSSDANLDPAVVTVRTRPGEPPSAVPVTPTPGSRTPAAPAPEASAMPTTAPPPAPVVYPGGARTVPDNLAMEPRAMEPSPALPAGPRIRVNASPSPVVSSGRTGGAARPPAPIEEPPLPAPAKEQSIVALRNDSSDTVEVTLEGNGSRTAHIPPGSTVPLRLEPGSYQLKASSGGASSANSSLTLKRNRTYSMLVNRQQENGKDYLVLIEPLEPSFDE